MSDPIRISAAAPSDDTILRVFERLRAGGAVTDVEYDAIYPEWVRRLSEHHWTPIDVCMRAADLLAGGERATILDVGSGAGKFCLIGAARTGATFVGGEQRPRLVELSRQLAARVELPNAEFVHGNVMTMDWERFDGFYFYNPFYEHILDYQPRINEPIVVSPQLYANYVIAACVKLALARSGARVVTYQGFGGPMPTGFHCLLREPAGPDWLELWEKG